MGGSEWVGRKRKMEYDFRRHDKDFYSMKQINFNHNLLVAMWKMQEGKDIIIHITHDAGLKYGCNSTNLKN